MSNEIVKYLHKVKWDGVERLEAAVKLGEQVHAQIAHYLKTGEDLKEKDEG